MKIGLALTFGILYWLATNKLWYGTLHLVRQPIVLAVPIGLIMGNLPDAMIMGASLQMIYLGAIAPGGTLPSDEALSSCIAIPLALLQGNFVHSDEQAAQTVYADDADDLEGDI